MTTKPLETMTHYMASMNYSSDVTVTFTSQSDTWNSENMTQIDDSTFDFILYQVTVPVLFGLITIVGATGNALVIYVILSQECMRTVTNILLLNLAVADLAFVIVVPPFTAFQMAAAFWPFGDAACRLMHYLVNVTAYVTVYTLVVISGMRYLTVVHATSTVRIRTRAVTIRVIATLWTVLSTANVPILLSYQTEPLNSSDGNPSSLVDCDLTSVDVGKPLFATFFAFGYVVPLGLIGILSVRIIGDIGRRRKAASDVIRRARSTRNKKPVGRTLALVVGLFAVLWLPVHLHLLVWFFIGPTNEQWYQVVSVIWNCLAYSNSCVNPIVYNHTSKDFRDSFRSVIQSTCRRRSAFSNPELVQAKHPLSGNDHVLCPLSPDADRVIESASTLPTPGSGRVGSPRQCFVLNSPSVASIDVDSVNDCDHGDGDIRLEKDSRET